MNYGLKGGHGFSAGLSIIKALVSKSPYDRDGKCFFCKRERGNSHDLTCIWERARVFLTRRGAK